MRDIEPPRLAFRTVLCKMLEISAALWLLRSANQQTKPFYAARSEDPSRKSR